MNSIAVNSLTSEEYADLLIENNNVPDVIQNFSDYTVNAINFLLSVVNVPVSYISNTTIQELGYAVFPSLMGPVSLSSIESSGILRLRSIPNFDLRGEGVLIGIIDTGIDYTNPIFQYEDGSSRIAAIWDQSIAGDNPPENQLYGTEYTRDQINIALQSTNPYAIVPSVDRLGHGTMIAGIAGGKPVPESNFYGVAPNADFVIVKLKPAKQYLKKFFFVPDDAVAFQENDVAFGLEYLLDVRSKLNKPMAIIIGVDTSQRSHDGRGTLSSQVSLYATLDGIAIVLPAGNEGNSRRHFSGTIDSQLGYTTVELNVGKNTDGFSMELWGQRPNTFSVDITSPSGEYIPRLLISRDEFREVTFIFEKTIIYVYYQMVETQSGDQLILLRFSQPAAGIWKINVYKRGDLTTGFNIWLPMTGFISDDVFFIRSDPYTTILTVGNSLIPITATAYDPLDDSLWSASSRGYTRIGEIKPDIAAPGVNVIGPTPDKGFSSFTGTSVAAAHTVGIAALLLEWGVVRGNLTSMSSVIIKRLMIRGARRKLDLAYPNRDWGYGIIDIYNIFDSLRSGFLM